MRDFDESPEALGLSVEHTKRIVMALNRALKRPSTRRHLGKVTQRPALVEQVVDRLRSSIVTGESAPGSELPPEGALCRTLGVSRTVVREAMRIVRAQGLVEVSQGKRPRVRPVDAQFAIDGLTLMLQRSDASLLHLSEVRRGVESEIAALAAERATPEQLEQMRQSIETLRGAPTLEARVDADLLFHRLLAEATGNPVFQVVLRTIWGLQRRSRLKTITYSRGEVAARWHERIYEAVRRGDAETARAEMLAHIDAARKDLLEATSSPTGTVR